MNLRQSFSLAVKSLMGSKMRSFLTMLGIIIGVASVIILISVMNGMTKQMLEQFESMGTNLISVNIRGRGGNRTVTPEDMQTLVDEHPDVISGISPNVSINNITVKVGNENDTTTCLGVNEAYPEIKNIEIENGRFLEYIDVDRRQKNCVIGTYIAKNYFEEESPLGKSIKVGGSSYHIIGILKETQDSEEGTDDDKIIIPYTLARNLSWNAFVSSYVISAATKETVDQATSVVEQKLLNIYSNSNAYSVFKQSEMMEMVNETTGTLAMVLVGVAAISLLVGGIGIMNIMLVSVTERTREIGIRKSLGARRRDILSQFVVEAATSSSIGGIMGIVLGIGGAFAVGGVMGLDATPSLSAIGIAFGVSAVIGITFGYFPASKASKLNPIEALRYD